MKPRHDWRKTNITRWTAIAVGIAVLTTLLPAVGPDLGPQAYAGDQQGTSDSSVPSAQAVFEHSSAVSEDLPPTF